MRISIERIAKCFRLLTTYIILYIHNYIFNIYIIHILHKYYIIYYNMNLEYYLFAKSTYICV